MHCPPCPFLLLLTLSSLLIFLSIPTSALPSCSPSDLISLEAFQSSISPILPWTNHTNCCSWLGVLCNTHGRVVSLHLPSSNLSGSISPHLFHLSALQSLNLSHNSLHGNIAADIANLSALTTLDLSHNPFLIGSLPLQLPSNLKYLDLSHCSFYGYIIINASSLEEVFIGDNFFSSFAADSKLSMKAVHTFDAPRNLFTFSILQTLQSCTNLLMLNLDSNYVGVLIPSEIGQFHNLEVMWLQGNGIAGTIPQELGNCKQMREIWLNVNNLEGTIPKELGKLSLLTTLSLSNNRLEGSVPDAIVGCTQLSFLSLSASMLTGEIPAALAVLPNLEVLLIADNRLSGSILWRVSRLGWVQVVDVAGNREIVDGVSAKLGDCECCESVMESRSECICVKIANKMPWRYILTLESLPLFHLNRGLVEQGIPWLLEASHEVSHVLALTLKHLLLSVRRAVGIFNFALVYLSSSDSMLQDNVYHHHQHRHRRFLQVSALASGSALSSTSPSPSSPPDIMLQDNIHHHHWHRHLLQSSADNSDHRPLIIAGIISGICVFCGILLIVLVVVLCRIKLHPWRKVRRQPPHPQKLPSLRRLRCESSQVFDPSLTSISMRDLAKATDDFHPGRVIGDGGFGLVFRATLNDGRTVAVKKLAMDGIQGKREFEAEMETLGNTKHRNLVELLAFCKVGEERALVYEFMENGSLDMWLHERNDGPQLLDWKRRVRITKGAARGLAYLHHDCNPHVIHRDIKSSNILLGKEFEARIADFGLARHMSPFLSHVSTDGAGTFGYMAPEYYLTLSATKQADVYSFGMLMLEIVSGRRPNAILDDKSFRALPLWAHHVVQFRHEIDLLDPVFRDKPAPLDEVRAYITVASQCVAERPEKRPTMKEVYAKLCLLEVDSDDGDENVEKSAESINEGITENSNSDCAIECGKDSILE